MPTTSEQPPHNSHEDPLLDAFDFLYAQTVARPALALSPDELQSRDEAVVALLAPLLQEPERTRGNHSDTQSDGQRYLEHAHLVLDPDGLIKSFSMSVPDALGYPTIRLAKRPLASLLAYASVSTWEGLLASLHGRSCFRYVTALTLLSFHHQPLPALCTVSRLLNSNQLQVSCIFVMQRLPVDIASLSHRKGFRKDAVLLQRLHDLILEHLDRPLPQITQLAKQLGTNTFNLKDGFKHYFNMGIYQFYTQERLARAKVMVLETDLPLPAIAEACGFSSASTFSKAFKKKYGLAPLPFKKARQDP